MRSVLSQLDTFMGQLDENKQDIVTAIESVNRLAVARKDQKQTIDRHASTSCPSALKALDQQRADLVKMLRGARPPERRRASG